MVPKLIILVLSMLVMRLDNHDVNIQKLCSAPRKKKSRNSKFREKIRFWVSKINI